MKVVQLSGQQARDLNAQVLNSNIMYVEAEEGKYEKKEYERWTLKPDGEKDLMEGIQRVYPHEAEKINDEGQNYKYFPVESKSKKPEVSEELKAARAEYEEVVGEKPHHKLSLEKMQEKISSLVTQ